MREDFPFFVVIVRYLIEGAKRKVAMETFSRKKLDKLM